MNANLEYDFIIAGMGCAGLSLAIQLSQSKVAFNKVLVIDKALKNQNDRTWCFWSKEAVAWYDPIVLKRWKQFRFLAPDFNKKYDLGAYHYNLIRGIDFYTYCLDQLKKDPRFEFIQDELKSLVSLENAAEAKCSNGTYSAKLIFNSAFRLQKVKPKHVNYVQHFTGWIIETKENSFDDACPVFMDFTTDQEDDFRFYYVIPYSKTKALIEYTGFSQKALKPEEYTRKLQAYIENKHPGIAYSVLETETGSIPMAESPFVNPFGKRVINIGTAGGHSKPSTGYTFYFIQKYTAQLVFQLENGKSLPTEPRQKNRFLYYDKIMLDVLHQKKQEGRLVFMRLFKKNKIEDLLDFLNEDSNPGTELKITSSVDKGLFLPSAIKKLFTP
ncbi:MAG: lycopene cyclase family protein [Bacteroidia bacterium]|nr:lycopene cyclase family protein [Bacteroidia bacterium]